MFEARGRHYDDPSNVMETGFLLRSECAFEPDHHFEWLAELFYYTGNIKLVLGNLGFPGTISGNYLVACQLDILPTLSLLASTFFFTSACVSSYRWTASASAYCQRIAEPNTSPSSENKNRIAETIRKSNNC